MYLKTLKYELLQEAQLCKTTVAGLHPNQDTLHRGAGPAGNNFESDRHVHGVKRTQGVGTPGTPPHHAINHAPDRRAQTHIWAKLLIANGLEQAPRGVLGGDM